MWKSGFLSNNTTIYFTNFNYILVYYIYFIVNII